MSLFNIAYMRYGKRIRKGNILRSLSGQYQPPTPRMIISQQKKQIKEFRESFTPEQRRSINQVLGIIKPYNQEFSNTVGKHIKHIEDWAASLYESKNYAAYKNGLPNAQQQMKLYQELLVQWKNIIQVLEKYSSNTLIKKRLEIFQQGVQSLEVSIGQNQVLDNNIISRVIWAGTTVKGFYLEEAGKEFLAEKLSRYDIEAIQTGQMKAKRTDTKSRVDLAQDIIVIPKNKKIQGMSLQNFLKESSVSKTIYLSDNEYQDFLSQGLGIQAKASRKGLVRIKNAGASIQEYWKWADSVQSVHSDMLKLLIQEVGNGGIRVEHPEYSAIANYIFSHHLVKNLHSNAFYLLRDGLYDTYGMLEKQLSSGNYVRIVNNKMHLIKGSSTIGIYLQ